MKSTKITIYLRFLSDEKGNKTKYISDIVSFTTNPELYEKYEMDESELNNLHYIYNNTRLEKDLKGEYHIVTDQDKIDEENRHYKTLELRNKRGPLLKAFDLWEKAVLRGREKDDKSIMTWYQQLLDLVESAFEDVNIPERIKYYLGQ